MIDPIADDDLIIVEAVEKRPRVRLGYQHPAGLIVFSITDTRDWPSRDLSAFTRAEDVYQKNRSLKATGKAEARLTGSEMRDILSLFRLIGMNLEDDDQRADWDSLATEDQMKLLEHYSAEIQKRRKQDEA